jgi:hypothetical protein
MAKLLFDSLRGVKLQKNLAQKIVQDAETLASKNVRCPQNRFFNSLPVNFRYHQTGITRPLKNQKEIGHLFIPWLLDTKIRL